MTKQHPVDELAGIRALIERLQRRERDLREFILASGVRHGCAWMVDVVEVKQEYLDKQALQFYLGSIYSEFVEEKNTTHVRLRRYDQTNVWDDDWRKKRRERPIPENVKRNVLVRADDQCESCGLQKDLFLHHLTYRHESGLIFGFETENDLMALCSECHHECHFTPDGEYILDPEECLRVTSRWWNERLRAGLKRKKTR